jgi:hypothetical protein
VKFLGAFVCALLLAATVGAATPDEVDAWKREFPFVRVAESFELRLMVSEYERLVAQATSANIAATVRMLHERVERDILDTKGRRSTEAREKFSWLVTRFQPFLRKMG